MREKGKNRKKHRDIFAEKERERDEREEENNISTSHGNIREPEYEMPDKLLTVPEEGSSESSVEANSVAGIYEVDDASWPNGPMQIPFTIPSDGISFDSNIQKQPIEDEVDETT